MSAGFHFTGAVVQVVGTVEVAGQPGIGKACSLLTARVMTAVQGHREGWRSQLRRPVCTSCAAAAWWTASVMVIPTEYDSHRPRMQSQPRKAWVPPTESVRISVWRPRRTHLGS
ncbi:hypothetical protein GCM10009753_04040 [Streptantibioticus ferralitis]